MRKENVVNKNKCFPGKFLSGVSRLYSRLVNKETSLFYQQRISGRSRIKCGITPLFDNSGFSPALVIPVLAVRANSLFYPSPLAGEGRVRGNKKRGITEQGNNFIIYPLIGFECLRTQNHFPRQGGSQTTSGFTLIELLVVVLIIGILAAVALPQYQTAVNKSRFSNLRTTAESLLKAAQSYTAATNEWPDNFDVLAVDLPGGFTQNKIGTFTCGKNTTMYCCMITGGGWSPAVTCGKKDYTFAFYSKYTTDLVIDAPMNNFCVAKESDANAKQLCKSLTKREGVLMGWGLVTPENTNLGGATGYRWYTL